MSVRHVAPWIVAVSLALGVLGVAHVALAEGQPTVAKSPTVLRAIPAERVTPAKAASPDRAQAALFWLFAVMTVGGSVFVITRRNLVAAVMGLVGTFFAVAAVYVMLYAHFLAAMQVLVYAGAIMVLFVFVVMILNRAEDEPWAVDGLFGKGVAAIAVVYLLARIGSVVWQVQRHAPAALDAVKGHYGSYAWGTTRALGLTLFRDYLFPFEAVSLLLLIAVVGGLAIARPSGRKPDSEPQP